MENSDVVVFNFTFQISTLPHSKGEGSGVALTFSWGRKLKHFAKGRFLFDIIIRSTKLISIKVYWVLLKVRFRIFRRFLCYLNA